MDKELEAPAHGGDLAGAVRRFGLAAAEFLDFSANINPLGPPAGVYRALAANPQAIEHYPEPFARGLRRQLAARLGLDPGQVLVANGAAALIYLFLHLKKPARVIISEPGFGEYARAARAAGAGVVGCKLKAEEGFRLDPLALAEVIRPGDVCVLCNPNNPTGNLCAGATLEAVVGLCRERSAWLLADESFLPFVPAGAGLSLARRAATLRHVVVIQSLTKIFALPGLRLGYAAGHEESITALEAALDPWNVNLPAQVAGMVALADEDYLARTRALVARERAFLETGLRQIGDIEPLPAAANFILCRLPAGVGSGEIYAAMGRRGILVRDCATFAGLGQEYIRVAVRRREENEKLLHHLAEVLALRQR